MVLMVLMTFLACGSEPVPDDLQDGGPQATSRKAPERPERGSQQKIIAFGDSLTAGFGIPHDEAYPAALQAILDADGYPYEVINAGVSGETSAGGVRRLDWVLEERDVAVFILELGANDGLRGLRPSEMKKNLNTIIDAAESRGIPVLLAGLSLGDSEHADRYVRDFVAVFEQVADERDVTFMPHFLDNVAGVAELNQADGKHPNVDGARIVAENVWEYLKPMLTPASSRS
jgi:acyl-CoA thioesterase-1